MTARGKYGAIPTTIDNIRFPSRAEASRYAELKLMVKAKQITDLALHTRYRLEVNGVLIGHFTDDFSYRTQAGVLTVEDVKGGTPSRDFPLRKKLMKALHGIDVVEVRR